MKISYDPDVDAVLSTINSQRSTTAEVSYFILLNSYFL